MALILVVDDEKDACRLMRQLLTRAGHGVITFHTGWEAVQWLGDHDPDLVLLHIKPWHGDALSVLDHIRRQRWRTRVIAITGYPRSESMRVAIQLGIQDCFVKPMEIQDLEMRINHALGMGSSQESTE